MEYKWSADTQGALYYSTMTDVALNLNLHSSPSPFGDASKWKTESCLAEVWDGTRLAYPSLNLTSPPGELHMFLYLSTVQIAL